jgi:hypothetical protein
MNKGRGVRQTTPNSALLAPRSPIKFGIQAYAAFRSCFKLCA